MNISLKMVDDLKIRSRRANEILGTCPVCDCKDANFNTSKLTWRCWHCFLPTAKVWCHDGIKNICDVVVGDQVLSDGGEFDTVISTHKLSYSGKIVEIKSHCLIDDIESTPEHKVFVLRYNTRKNDQTRIDWCGTFSIEEITAEEVKPKDWLIYPISMVENVSEIETVSYTSGEKLLPNKLLINDDFLRISGLFIAEGSTYRGGVQYSFSSSETNLANEVRYYFERLGLKVSEARNYKPTQLVLKISNTHVQKTFEYWFGKGCNNKKIPPELLSLSNEKTSVLLSAIWDGDGCGAVLGQTSKTLAYQVKQLLSRLEPVSSGVHSSNNKKPVYNVYKRKLRHSCSSFSKLFHTWYNVIEVDSVSSREESDIYVYDLTTKKSGKYTVNGVLVHNCNASGRIIPEEGYVFKEEEEPVLDIPEVRKLYTSLAQKYHGRLTQPVLEYLKTRGLTQQTIDSFMLGFCPTDFFDDYSNKLAEESGILYQNYPVLTNRITIPYVAGGEVTDLRGRIVSSVITYKDGTPTYSSLSGNHKTRGATFLFNYDIIAKNHRIILTEGEFKAIVGYQHGFPVVAMPGIHGWQKDWAVLFRDKELILAPDSDGFGGSRSPAYRMVNMIAQDVPDAKVAILRLMKRYEKEDIDSMIVSGGLKTFERAVEGAIPVKIWLKQEERKGYVRKRD